MLIIAASKELQSDAIDNEANELRKIANLFKKKITPKQLKELSEAHEKTKLLSKAYRKLDDKLMGRANKGIVDEKELQDVEKKFEEAAKTEWRILGVVAKNLEPELCGSISYCEVQMTEGDLRYSTEWRRGKPVFRSVGTPHSARNFRISAVDYEKGIFELKTWTDDFFVSNGLVDRAGKKAPQIESFMVTARNDGSEPKIKAAIYDGFADQSSWEYDYKEDFLNKSFELCTIRVNDAVQSIKKSVSPYVFVGEKPEDKTQELSSEQEQFGPASLETK